MTLAVKVPLCHNFHNKAKNLAKYQPNVPIGKQVYLNSLATNSVKSYFSWLQIKSQIHPKCDFELNSTLKSSMMLFLQDSDYYLHCKPILPEQTVARTEDSIDDANFLGTVWVQLTQTLNFAEILGFSPKKYPREITITNLDRSLDCLIKAIYQKQ